MLSVVIIIIIIIVIVVVVIVVIIVVVILIVVAGSITKERDTEKCRGERGGRITMLICHILTFEMKCKIRT